MESEIFNIMHPNYNDNSMHWAKYELTYEGGSGFIKRYLKKFSNREDQREFQRRKDVTYCPSFAKMAINEIRNAICQRMPDISREGGPESYLTSCAGLNGGVDKGGSSMNLFMGEKVIPGLLSIGRIGVYVDMPPLYGQTIADKGEEKPYIYIYKAKDIRSWTYDRGRLISVLLQDCNYIHDEKTGLTIGTADNYRHLWLNEGKVNVQIYDKDGLKRDDLIILNLPEIPFEIADLPFSLLHDVADYQIALLNIESSDIAYILKSNYPLYTEQFDPRSESPYIKQPGITAMEIYQNYSSETNSITTTTNNVQEIEAGASSGRRYPIHTERPGFINPSSDPLKISMAKVEQIKKDIRLLVNLAVENIGIKPGVTSSLEAGLSLIGYKIESVERKIARIWSFYEGTKEITTISYPETYSLKSEEERRKEASDLEALLSKVPSKTFQKEVTKKISEVLISHTIPYSTLNKIYQEIDSAEVVISDPDIIKIDLEGGLVSTELASKIRGYPEGQVEQAKKDHSERILRIAMAQSQGAGAIANPDARGTPDLSVDPKGAQTEKAKSRDTTLDNTPTDKTRGEGI